MSVKSPPAVIVTPTEGDELISKDTSCSGTHNLHSIGLCRSSKERLRKVIRPVTIYCLNAQSVKNKASSLADLIVDLDMDILAVTETWMDTAVDQQVKSELVPTGYSIIAVPRPDQRRGGGLALVYKSGLSTKIVSSSLDKQYTQFEHMECVVTSNDAALRICVVYRPPTCTRNGLKVSAFFEEWPKYLDQLSASPIDPVLVGDINFHLDMPTNTSTAHFNSLLGTYGLMQHISGPTHKKGHTLDIVITRESFKPTLCGIPSVRDLGVGDHFATCVGLWKRPEEALQGGQKPAGSCTARA